VLTCYLNVPPGLPQCMRLISVDSCLGKRQVCRISVIVFVLGRENCPCSECQCWKQTFTLILNLMTGVSQLEDPRGIA
jgi:hypothetical protein